MNYPQNALKALFAGTMVFCLSFSLLILPGSANAQAIPNPAPANVSIPGGSYVIPMDNNYQGQALDNDCSDSAFNLKAYGLAVRLLHHNIPLKWVISATKTSKDGTDFTAAVQRIQGRSNSGSLPSNQRCSEENGTFNFAGGPLVISTEYTALAAPFIEEFNDEIDNNSEGRGRVRVYETTAATTAPVRYTLTHKPLVAVGPDGGGFGDGVYDKLFKWAMITSDPGVNAYSKVNNDVIGPGSCYTLAAQAHAAEDAHKFIEEYRNFATTGGNLLLQCHSIDVFENDLVDGLFQTTNGWRLYGTNSPSDDVVTPLLYPSAGMAFNQFIGDMSNATGRVTEFKLASNSNYRPSTLISARNTSNSNGNFSDRNVATVSRVGSSLAGGNIFELGGHEYDGTSSDIKEKNGARMVLNTLLVPANRPGCSLEIPQVLGYKHVQLTNDVNNNGFINPGDTVTWTINYINTSNVAASSFQISDPIQAGMTVTTTGAQTVLVTGAGTSAAKNPNYNGTSNMNMLASGATLGAGGRITVVIPTIISQGTYGTLLNHPTATGAGIASSGVVTDTIDGTTIGTQGGVQAPSGSYNQNPWQTSGLDPTGIQILSPSAADSTVSGRVQTPNGVGLSRAVVTLLNVATGESRSVTTGTFGSFQFDQVETGDFHIVSVQHQRFSFLVSSYSFTVNGNITGLTFVGTSFDTGR